MRSHNAGLEINRHINLNIKATCRYKEPPFVACWLPLNSRPYLVERHKDSVNCGSCQECKKKSNVYV